MIRFSTGLKTALLGSYGVSSMLEKGSIHLYTGLQPHSADFAPTGILVARVTNDGIAFAAGREEAGLALDKTGLGVLRDEGNWVVRGQGGGTIGWWRWRWLSDDPMEFSLYYPRIDGAAGESLILSNYSVTPATRTPIDGFFMTIEEK